MSEKVVIKIDAEGFRIMLSENGDSVLLRWDWLDRMRSDAVLCAPRPMEFRLPPVEG